MIDPEVILDQVEAAAFEVHHNLPPGLPSMIYEDALGLEFAMRGLEYRQQVATQITYKGHQIRGQPVSVLVEERVVVDVRVAQDLPDYTRAQFVTFLKSLGLGHGLMLNFGKVRFAEAIYRVSLPSQGPAYAGY
jgi:GxxExxY protein